MAFNPNGQPFTPQPMYNNYMMTRSHSNPSSLYQGLTPAQAALQQAQAALQVAQENSFMVDQAQQSMAAANNDPGTPKRRTKKTKKLGKGAGGKGKGGGKSKTGAKANGKDIGIVPSRGKSGFSKLTPDKSNKKQADKKQNFGKAISIPPTIDKMIQSEVKVQLAKQSTINSDMSDAEAVIEKTKICDGFIGPYDDILASQDDRTNFSKSVSKFTKNPQLINVNDENFTPETFTPKTLDANVQMRHVYIRMSPKWFEKDLQVATTTTVNGQVSEAGAKFVAFMTVHDKIHSIVEKITSAYKPTGVVFMLTSSYVVSDAMINSYASMNGHVIIQFDCIGRKRLDEIEPEYQAGIFGHRIGLIADFYKNYTKKVNQDTSTKKDTVYQL